MGILIHPFKDSYTDKDDSAACEGIESNKESEVDSDTDVSVELPAADCGAALLNKLLATC